MRNRSRIRQITEMKRNQQQMIEWIVNTLGYPMDMTTDPPIPAAWQNAVVDKWIQVDGLQDDPHEAEAREWIALEGGWLFDQETHHLR